MKAAFDDSAASYDADFTNTSIGRLQRNKVWGYLEKTFMHSFPNNVLELNCGTGEDAVFLAEHSCQVLATDVSEEMLAVTRLKAQQKDHSHLITTARLDITDFDVENTAAKYDLIFSNFGGLNCIDQDEIEKLINDLTKMLNSGGRVILILMPRFCFWETVYFTSKLKFRKAFRRRSYHHQEAALSAGKVNVWYHHPNYIKSISAKYYNIKNMQPVGISLPPSYLQKTFLTRANILNRLDRLENKLNKYPFLSAFADHYLIDLELK
jgi:ubiquinone/menaquinone biosynthesis C-methylase UbiE